MENSRKIERQKFFKNPHVETVETENRIFVENWLGKISDTQKNFRNFGNFRLSSTFFEKKRALQTQSGCILWNMQPFFKTGNRKFVCIKWKNEARKTAIHLPLMGLGFDVFDDIFYQLL